MTVKVKKKLNQCKRDPSCFFDIYPIKLCTLIKFYINLTFTDFFKILISRNYLLSKIKFI